MTTTCARPLNQIPAREWRSKYLELVNWNSYQQRIFDWVQNGSGNAMVGAVAGSGKTSSITGIVAALPATSKIQIVAFNVHIAQQLKQDSRIPKGRVTVSTAHSLGSSVLTGYFGGKLFDPDESKYFQLSKKAVQNLLTERVDYDILNRQNPEEAALKYPVPPPPLTAANHQSEVLAKALRRFIQNVVRFAQMTLTPLNLKDLVGMVDHFGIEVPNSFGALEWGILEAIKVLEAGERLAASQQSISFEDMLWLPNKWDLKLSRKDFLLVDEAQDVNAAMIGLYQRMVDQGARVILLGDERQAIFGFNGSDTESWQSLRQVFSPVELPLSVCYRCPSSHLRLARRIVPEIEDRPNALLGVLEVLHPDRVFELVAPNDLILCRLTAPLIDLCLKLIIRGEHARVRGRNLGKQLADLADTAAGASAYPSEFQQALNDYCFPKIKTLLDDGEESEAESLSDRRLAVTTCFETFGRECRTLKEFGERMKALFTDDEAAIILATIHRAKGDESARVFLLGTNFLPFTFKSTKAWQLKQEWNLVYVALTRAKKELYLVPLARNEKDKEQLPQHLEHPLGGMQLPSNAVDKDEASEETSVKESDEPEAAPMPALPAEAPVVVTPNWKPQIGARAWSETWKTVVIVNRFYTADDSEMAIVERLVGCSCATERVDALQPATDAQIADVENQEPEPVSLVDVAPIPAPIYTPEEQAEIDACIVQELADVLTQCQTYQEVLDLIELFSQFKAAAWALLSREEKARIHALKSAEQQQRCLVASSI